jgi:hypothetical protein
VLSCEEFELRYFNGKSQIEGPITVKHVIFLELCLLFPFEVWSQHEILFCCIHLI